MGMQFLSFITIIVLKQNNLTCFVSLDLAILFSLPICMEARLLQTILMMEMRKKERKMNGFFVLQLFIVVVVLAIIAVVSIVRLPIMSYFNCWLERKPNNNNNNKCLFLLIVYYV
jgi:uncharacterized membrane protein YhaH (DUF805 family)